MTSPITENSANAGAIAFTLVLESWHDAKTLIASTSLVNCSLQLDSADNR